MKQPFFSVLIPTYNRPDYLEKCVRSVLDNDFKDFEILISDDCSQKQIEEIKAVVEPYLRYQNVSFFRQPENLGFQENWNFLVSKAQGKFVMIMGDDDKLRPDTLRKLKENIDRFPDYDLYGFGYEVIDEKDRFRCSYCPPKSFELSLEKSKFIKNLFYSDVLPFWVFHSFTVCYKREIAEKIKYRKEASIGADLAFLFRCLSSGKKMFVIPEVLFSYRKHSSNWTGPPITNIISRRNILYDILYQSQDLDSYISEFVLKPSFRKRYLYNPIIFNRLMGEESLSKVVLKEEHLKELKNFFKPKSYLFHHFRIRLGQLMDYAKLFGPKALLYITKRFYQIKNNKIKNI